MVGVPDKSSEHIKAGRCLEQLCLGSACRFNGLARPEVSFSQTKGHSKSSSTKGFLDGVCGSCYGRQPFCKGFECHVPLLRVIFVTRSLNAYVSSVCFLFFLCVCVCVRVLLAHVLGHVCVLPLDGEYRSQIHVTSSVDGMRLCFAGWGDGHQVRDDWKGRE